MPLSHLKVLDFTNFLPGPCCTLILADLGAEVLKIENPAGGDPARGFLAHPGPHESPQFLAVNRHKRSLALNLKDPVAVEIIWRLAESGYDTWVEGFRPGVMDRLGLGHRTALARMPRLIYASITGFGQEGPLNQRAGHDIGYLALTGLFSGIRGPVHGPALDAFQVADLSGGSLSATVAILAAEVRRRKTGQGAYLDVAMHDSTMFLSGFAAAGLWSGERPRQENVRLLADYPCYNVYRSSDDRWVVLAAVEEKFWLNFLKAADRLDLAGRQYDPSPEVFEEVARIFAGKTFAQWRETADGVEACLEGVLNFEEAWREPQVAARGLSVTLEDPRRGPLTQPAEMVRLGRGAAGAAPPPRLGEHTRQVLEELGYDRKDVAELAARGAVALDGE